MSFVYYIDREFLKYCLLNIMLGDLIENKYFGFNLLNFFLIMIFKNVKKI